ncbi:MAG: hypothetical protein DHS20C19_25610 [Acidimicrobiales bacterium]|nr:MAG: hypothetical protein DHS20C19_25610 [Acidimicrobiales bacterium]
MLAVAFFVVPSVGAEPDISVPAPTGAPADGDVIALVIDGSNGFDGADAIFITSCANADNSFEPWFGDAQGRCHENGVVPPTVSNGATFSGAGLLPNPVDGEQYSFSYVWDTDFPGDAVCFADAPVPCRIQLVGVTVTATEVWRHDVAVSTVKELPTAVIDATVSTVEGDSGDTVLDIDLSLSREVPWSVYAYVDLVDVETNSSRHSYPTADPLDLRIEVDDVDFSVDDHVTVRVFGDNLDEIDERAIVRVRLEGGGATIGGFYGLSIVTILDDDEPPRLIPGNVGVLEDDTTVMVPFTLDSYSGKDVTFDWVIGGHGPTSNAGEDYVAGSGTATIPAGERTVEIPVEILGDDVPEQDEIVLVALQNLQNARPGGYFGLAFLGVFNDEPFPDCLDRLGPGANLSWCDLSGVTLLGEDLTGADLRGANLSGATIVNGDWSGIVATDVDLDGATFANVNLSDADFSGGAGAVTFTNSTLDFALMDGAFEGSRIIGSSALGVYLHGRFDDGLFSLSDFTGGDITTARYPRAVWSGATCADGAASRDTFDTCQRVLIFSLREGRFGASDVVTSGVPEGEDVFFRMVLEGSEGFLPGITFFGAQFWAGPTGFEAEMTGGGTTVVDQTGNGFPDANWSGLSSELEINVSDSELCVAGYNSREERAFGCRAVTVVEWEDDSEPPISPPASPPSSPSSSPPISGSGLSALTSFLAEPVGLMATSAAVGLFFLLGSRRAETTLRDEREEDGGDDQE